MSRRKHPAFKEPDTDTKVWRYMSFTKFVSMLENSGLYFCPVNKLGDPFEASVPQRWIEKSQLERAALDEQGFHGAQGVVGGSREVLEKIRPWVMVNCWHMNTYESAAMWKLYCESSEGICIQSTYQSLANCLEEDVFIGEVTYISYEADSIPIGNLFWPFMYKRKSFEHERELRALVCDLTRAMAGTDAPPAAGSWRRVDLSKLIHKIYVAPTTVNWVVDLISAVIRKYNFAFEVEHSALDAEPIR